MPAGRQSLASTLGWAAFLGMSWTWCIGMFLPVLLVRDFGTIGWWVFAVPNVVGAAAMGWLVRDGEHSRRLVAAHAPMCAAFSLVTIGYQIFFASWWLPRTAGLMAVALPVAAAIFWIAGRDQPRGRAWNDARSAVVLLAISLGLLVAYAGITKRPNDWDVRLPQSALWPLLPAMSFGFLLCPYLDLTFHRARQAVSAAGGRVAFGVGLGVFFSAMIVFTLLYAMNGNDLIRGLRGHGGDLAATLIGLQMTLQLAYTGVVHARSLDSYAVRSALPAKSNIPLIVRQPTILLTFAGTAAMLGVAARGNAFGMQTGEFVYWLFLGCYGTLFPAYVWLAMMPSWRQPKPPTTRTWLIIAIAVVLSFPCFWLAFINHRTPWLWLGVAILLALRLTRQRSA